MKTLKRWRVEYHTNPVGRVSVENSTTESEETLSERVGDETATALEDADVTHDELAQKEVSYRELVMAGIDADTAAAVRREFSLQWSFVLGDGLDERSNDMNNLSANERQWIAASEGDWENAEYDPVFEEREEVDVWADRERPTPVIEIPGVGPDDAEKLARAGVNSVKQLSWVPAAFVADALDLDVRMVRTWRFQAREHDR